MKFAMSHQFIDVGVVFSLFQSPMSDDPPGGRVALKPPSRMTATVISDGLFFSKREVKKPRLSSYSSRPAAVCCRKLLG